MFVNDQLGLSIARWGDIASSVGTGIRGHVGNVQGADIGEVIGSVVGDTAGELDDYQS
jgi:hypothetical protein